MGATPIKLNFEDQALLDTLNWLEQSYRDKVYVLDIHFDLGTATIYGEEEEVAKFREQIGNMMAAVYKHVPPWREL